MSDSNSTSINLNGIEDKANKTSNKRSTLHAIIRTSPKGKGQEFIGTCMNCGVENLTFKDMSKYCENVVGRTNTDNIISAINGGD